MFFWLCLTFLPDKKKSFYLIVNVFPFLLHLSLWNKNHLCHLQTRTTRLVFAIIGAIIFSLYIVFDTQMMMGGNHKVKFCEEFDPILNFFSVFVGSWRVCLCCTQSLPRHHQSLPLHSADNWIIQRLELQPSQFWVEVSCFGGRVTQLNYTTKQAKYIYKRRVFISS